VAPRTHADPRVLSAGRRGPYTHVDAAPGAIERAAPVLRQPLRRAVQPRHDLYAGHDRAHELAARPASDVQLPVDAVANQHLFLFGLDVDVARALLDGLKKQPVHPADDRRVLVRLEDVDFVLFGV